MEINKLSHIMYVMFSVFCWILLFKHLPKEISIPLFVVIELDFFFNLIKGFFEGFEIGAKKARSENGKS